MTDHEGWSVIDLALWREYCALVEHDVSANTPVTTPYTVSGAWRDLPPTFKQEKLLKKFGKVATTRGEAATMISALPPRVR